MENEGRLLVPRLLSLVFSSSVSYSTANRQLLASHEVCYNLLVSDQEVKVLSGLMERRALEAEFDALAQAQNATELARRAQRIADRGGACLPVLLARLDTDDPHVRGGLGLLAQRLDRDAVVPALKAAIRSRERTDRTRVTALTLLNRYLEEPVGDDLLAAIGDPGSMALQSLRELIGAMAANPAALVDYLDQLAQQPPEVPGMLMQALPQLMPNPHLISLLRMFAQGNDTRLAQQAVDLLGRTRTREALLALTSLAVALPPDRAALADRGQRKLRMSGVQAVPDAPPSAWRAFLSPVDGTGAQVIWFVCQQDDAASVQAMTVVTGDPAGIVAAFGGADVAASDVPPVVPEGEILSAPQPGERRPLMLLSVPFDVGRQAAQNAVQLNWRSGSPPPLLFRFLNDMIWQYGAVEAMPAEAELEESLVRRTAGLLDHPAFAGWFWQAPALYDAAEKLGLKHTLGARFAAVTQLAEEAFGAADVTSYSRRLLANANWLRLAGQDEAAALAQAAAAQLKAASLAAAPPAESPFVRRLIGVGLDIAAINLRSGYDLRRET